jgi:hypothetical protein
LRSPARRQEMIIFLFSFFFFQIFRVTLRKHVWFC